MPLALVDGKLVNLVPKKKVLIFTRPDDLTTYLGEVPQVANDLTAASELVKSADVTGNTVVLSPEGDGDAAAPKA